ncbi:MAG: hypothetical protein V4621_07950 [Pseudomonadota bacterium]
MEFTSIHEPAFTPAEEPTAQILKAAHMRHVINSQLHSLQLAELEAVSHFLESFGLDQRMITLQTLLASKSFGM